MLEQLNSQMNVLQVAILELLQGLVPDTLRAKARNGATPAHDAAFQGAPAESLQGGVDQIHGVSGSMDYGEGNPPTKVPNHSFRGSGADPRLVKVCKLHASGGLGNTNACSITTSPRSTCHPAAPS